MGCSAVEPREIPSSGLRTDSPTAANLSVSAGQKECIAVRGISARIRSASLAVLGNESIQVVPHFKQCLAFLIADVPEVRAVLMRQDNQDKSVLDVYVVVDEFDFAVNERIYDKEEHIMGVFTSFDFDFHITTHLASSDPDLEVAFSR